MAEKSVLVKAGLCAAAAIVLLTGVCAGQGSATPMLGLSSGGSSPGGASSPPIVERPSTVKHWGTFFGALEGENYDLATSPVALTVPGTVAEIGSSNSTEYALLTNGSLYAWGLGTQGELGDGSTANSLTEPVRVRFPPGVKIAYIPTDAMPYDTGLAVDTTGHAWGWGENGGGEFCLGNRRSHTTPVELPLSGVTALAGASHHAVYDADGTVYACGQNLEGTLGDGSWSNSTRPRKVADLDGASVTKLIGPVLIAAIPATGFLDGAVPGGWRFVPVVYAGLLVLMAAAVWFLCPREDRMPARGRPFAELVAPLTDFPEVGATAELALEVAGHDVPVRVYRPSGSPRPGTVVFLHGGGWVFGDLRSHDGMCR